MSRVRRAHGLVALACAVASVLARPAAAADDAIRWRTRLVPEHRDFMAVWVDTRELPVGHTLEQVTLRVACQDGDGQAIGEVAFPFTDPVQPALQRGVVYVRYYRHGCPEAHRIEGRVLRYREATGHVGPLRSATLRSERIRVPGRQLTLIGASPYRTVDASAYCGPLPPNAAPVSDPK